MSNHWQQDASATCREHVRLLCGDPQGQSRMHPYQFNLIDSKSVETNADELCWEEKEALLMSFAGKLQIVGLLDYGTCSFFAWRIFRGHISLYDLDPHAVQAEVSLGLLGSRKESKHTWTYTNLETSWLISNLNLTRNNSFCIAQRTFASSETHVGWTQKRECTKNSSLRRCEVVKCFLEVAGKVLWDFRAFLLADKLRFLFTADGVLASSGLDLATLNVGCLKKRGMSCTLIL